MFFKGLNNGKIVQFTSGFTVMLAMICAGLHIGWSCPALPRIFKGEAGFDVARDEASWIVSMLTFGGGCGGILAKFLVDRIGRKISIVLLALPYICGWLLIMFSKSGAYLFAAQIIAGLSLGVSLVVGGMYLGEIAEIHLRGALCSTLNFGMNVGCLISYLIGPHFSYREATYLCILFPILLLFAALWLPESPYYHMMKGNKEKAASCLARLRDSNKKEAISKELELIEITVIQDMERRGNIKELFTNAMYRRGIIVAFGLRSLQQLNGNMALNAYLQMIMEDARVNFVSPSQATIIYGIVQVIAGVLATILTDKLGRKILLFVSFIGLGITMIILGVYFFIQDYMNYPPNVMKAINWIPVLCVLLFCLCNSVGIGSLGFVMLSEMFPTNVKCIGVCIGSAFGTYLTFVVTKSYLVISDSIGSYVAFWIFAAFSFSGVAFTYFLVPETKNKSFQEIQDKLNREKPSKTYFEIDRTVVLTTVTKTAF